MDHTETPRAAASPATIDPEARVHAIRARLPGQMLRERLEMAQVCYGPLYSLADVRLRIAHTLPRRPGFVRGAVLESIEDYRQHIPDEALLKYDDAVKSRLFAKFWVATPAYYQERQIDPWIIGEVTGTDRYAVIAQWEV
jgi:hypothetical protein